MSVRDTNDSPYFLPLPVGASWAYLPPSDRSVTLINAVEGRKRKTIHTQKYGCGVIRYTHHDQVRGGGSSARSREPPAVSHQTL